MSTKTAPAPRISTKEMLERLTPAKVRELGEEYGTKLTGYTNTTWDQWLFLTAAAFLLIAIGAAISFQFLPWLLPVFRYSGFAQFLVFVAICAAPFMRARYFFRYAGPYMVIRGTYFFGGALHPANTGGGRLKAPYVIVNDKDYIDVRLIIIEGKTAFVTKDGVVITYNWTMQCRINPLLLPLNTRVDLKTMAKGIADVVENVFQREFLGKSAKTLRSKETVIQMENRLTGVLNAPLPEWRTEDDPEVAVDNEHNPIWVRYGLIIEISTLGAPDFNDDYKEALNAKAIADLINEAAKQFIDDTEASPDVALNSALIINKENVTRQVFTVEGVEKWAGQAINTVMRVSRKKEGK